jgi:hypothetical protein
MRTVPLEPEQVGSHVPDVGEWTRDEERAVTIPRTEALA